MLSQVMVEQMQSAGSPCLTQECVEETQAFLTLPEDEPSLKTVKKGGVVFN